MEMVQVEVWVLVDEDGDYEVSKDASDLQPGAGLASRMVKVTLNVSKPRPVELQATVSEEPTTGELKVA